MTITTADEDGRNGSVRAQDVSRRRFLLGVGGLLATSFVGSQVVAEVKRADEAAMNAAFHLAIAEQFMRRAIELSRTGMEAGDGGPFGAIVVKGREIVGEGWNRVIATNDPTAHGEIVAIRRATASLGDFNLSGCELYTSAQPCPMCLGAIYWARIDRIYYGNSAKDAAAIGFDDEMSYQQLMRPSRERRVPEAPLLGEEARRVFNEYLAKPDRVRY